MPLLLNRVIAPEVTHWIEGIASEKPVSVHGEATCHMGPGRNDFTLDALLRMDQDRHCILRYRIQFNILLS
jgi:hypothetical protein